MREFPLIPPTVERALLLYGCEYDGQNDGRHVLAAGIQDVVVVDTNHEAISRMAQKYPSGWRFVPGDAMRFVFDCGSRGVSYDLVVADPYGGDEMERVHRHLGEMGHLARDMLIVGARNDDDVPTPYPGVLEKLWRSERYCWWAFSK